MKREIKVSFHWQGIIVCLIARVNDDGVTRLKQLFPSFSRRFNNVSTDLAVKSCVRDESGRSRITWKAFPDRWLECGLDVDTQLRARVCELCDHAADLGETDFPRHYHKILDSWTNIFILRFRWWCAIESSFKLKTLFHIKPGKKNRVDFYDVCKTSVTFRVNLTYVWWWEQWKY